MKFFIVTFVLCISLGIDINAANAQSYVWQTLSPSNAIQEVQAFEGNANLAVTVMSLSPDVYPLTISVTQTPAANAIPAPNIGYSLTSGHYDYRVCAFSHDMFSRSDNIFYMNKSLFYGQPYDTNVLAPLAMSQSAAKTIAQAYMTAHFPHPELLTQVTLGSTAGFKKNPTDADFIEVYKFNFYQQSSNGVVGPADCRIDVDTVKGQIVHYFACSFPLLISSVPSLTRNQATASAMNALNVAQGVPAASTGIDIGWPDAFGNETVLYYVNFSGIPLPAGQTDPTGNYAQNYTATVDGFTGKVVSFSSLMSIGSSIKKTPSSAFNALRARMKSTNGKSPQEIKCFWAGKEVKLNHPTYVISGQPYLHASYLCYGLSDAKLNVGKDSQAGVTSTKRQISFSPNSYSYIFNGKCYRLTVKPISLNGQCYVPLDVMQTVFGGQWSYNKQTQTVHYDPRKPANAKQPKRTGLPMLAAFLLSVSLLTVTAAVCKPHAHESSDIFGKQS